MATEHGAAPRAATGPDLLDTASLDAAVNKVASHVDDWVATSPHERAVLLQRVVRDTLAVAGSWNDAACRAKGYDPTGPTGAEELFAGVGVFVRMAQALRRTMEDLATGGRPRYRGPVRPRPGGRIAIQVAPATTLERYLNHGVTGEVWFPPGVTEAAVRAAQAPAYADPVGHGGVALVLGAGNVASLGPRDVLSKLFADGQVVVLKANPVNDYLVPYWRVAMSSLIELGVLRIVTGGAAAGAYLVHHPRVDTVHVTGSDKTYDAIVFGPGEEGARRRARGERYLTKPVTGELGNVSPVVVVPGEWDARDLGYQARHVATMLVNNAGFNCLTPRVLVTHAGWPQRGAFLAALEEVLAAQPTRRAYYPGAANTHAAFLAAHPDAHQVGTGPVDALPWTVAADVDPRATDDSAFCVESFGPQLSETALAASSPAAFLSAAVAFCNDVLWGSLSATVLAHPASLRDREVGPAVERAVADLRYGSIGVNLWHAMSFAFATTTWGAYPGHAVSDIQSGCGVVGNALLFADPEKSVVTGPFRARPEPPWFASNPRAPRVMAHLLAFEGDPRWIRLPGLLAAALRS